MLLKYYPIIKRIALESKGDPDVAEERVVNVFACLTKKKIFKKALIKAVRELTLISRGY